MNGRIFKALMLIAWIVFLLTAPGCRKDCKLIREYLLTEQQKKQIPFKGKEIITFSSGQNEIELIGTDRIDTLEKRYPSGFSCDYYMEENNFITFKNKDYHLHLRMTAGHNFNLTLYDYIEGLHMSAYLRVAQTTGELSEYEELIDSLTVNNSLYLNVYKDTVSNVYPLNARKLSIYATYIYYSTEYGVVKIDFSDSTSWELKNIEW